MNCKKMYDNLVMTNFFIFKYNLGFESAVETEDLTDLEVPN